MWTPYPGDAVPSELATKDKILDLWLRLRSSRYLAAKIAGPPGACDVSPAAVSFIPTERGAQRCRRSLDPKRRVSPFADGNFTLILSTCLIMDFSVPKHSSREGYGALAAGGKLILVTKRVSLTGALVASVSREIDGYFVFLQEKRTQRKKSKKKPQTLQKKRTATKIYIINRTQLTEVVFDFVLWSHNAD